MIMGRKKIKHELISNESARKVTFRKRKAGLLKKLEELTTLCGIIACAVIFSAYDDQPDIWPSPAEALLVLEKYENMPTKKQEKYMMDQETFLVTRISKLNRQLEKQMKRNRSLELESAFADCRSGMDSNPLDNDKNLKDRIQLLNVMIRSIKDEIADAKSENKDLTVQGIEKGLFQE